MDNHTYLVEERIGKLMQKYAIPCIISLLVGALYNIVGYNMGAKLFAASRNCSQNC